ncbi:MAG: 3-oxoacyl-[acyl-carrier-protein] reductase [Sorangium cellulosum]|nr:MAG: 3-oxoacyl-[acyl-carrier-protein] reductase [Sorangium cellulosum]
MYRLDKKVALVTGASRGIGRATARLLASQGAKVFVNYRQNEEAATNVVTAIEQAGGFAQAVAFDVADSKAVESSISNIAKNEGHIDIVVANAGIALDGLLMRGKDDDFQSMMDVNVRGAWACARSAIKPMIRARKGRVVFVSSVIGEMGNVGQSAYAATKAALIGMTKSLAREVGSRNITVNVVSPGLIDTDMTARLSDETRGKAIAQIPVGRLGDPAEVAAAILFLCSDEASYVTGHTLRVNGGMYV